MVLNRAMLSVKVHNNAKPQMPLVGCVLRVHLPRLHLGAKVTEEIICLYYCETHEGFGQDGITAVAHCAHGATKPQELDVMVTSFLSGFFSLEASGTIQAARST